MDKLYITAKLNESIEIKNSFGSGNITIPKGSWFIGKLTRVGNNEDHTDYNNCQIIAWTEEYPKHGLDYNSSISLHTEIGDWSVYNVGLYDNTPVSYVHVYKEETSIEYLISNLVDEVLNENYDFNYFG